MRGQIQDFSYIGGDIRRLARAWCMVFEMARHNDNSGKSIRLTNEQITVFRRAYQQRHQEIAVNIGRANTDLALNNLKGEFRTAAEELYLIYGKLLTDWIGRLCREYDVPTKRSPLWLVRWLADRPAFWRRSREARYWFAQFNEIHEVDVSSYMRAGRQVSGYVRFLGNEHLLALPVDDYPPAVGEVLCLIAEGAHRTRRGGKNG